MIRIDGYIGEHPNTAAALSDQLTSANGQPISAIINSGGGDAFEGAAIRAELAAYPGEVTVEIRGIAASAASLLVMGADMILIDNAATFMIHDPSGLTVGPPSKHRETADTLDKLADIYAAAYARRSGNSENEVRGWMQAETWLTAEEAVLLGFADQVVGNSPEMVKPFDITAFHHAPRDLKALATAQGWATLSPVEAPAAG